MVVDLPAPFGPRKAKRDPRLTLKEISSRTGSWNPVTGKWEKFKTPEAMAKWYSADYSKAKE